MRGRTKSEYKTGLRDQAKRRINVQTRYEFVTLADYQKQVEKGLKELTRVSLEAGDSKIKRVKNELTYLLNNYSPRYETRIQFLINEWRRSGDPSYDRGIQVRFREVRRDHMNKSNPL